MAQNCSNCVHVNIEINQIEIRQNIPFLYKIETQLNQIQSNRGVWQFMVAKQQSTYEGVCVCTGIHTNKQPTSKLGDKTC